VVAQEARQPSQPISPPAGFMAYRDPITGRLGNPTAEQSAALTAAARQPTAAPIAKPRAAAPRIVRPPLGGISVMLDDSHARYATARKAADGSISESCEPSGEQK
jgi:hypothetical protein